MLNERDYSSEEVNLFMCGEAQECPPTRQRERECLAIGFEASVDRSSTVSSSPLKSPNALWPTQGTVNTQLVSL